MYKSSQIDYINPSDVAINYFIPHPNRTLNNRYSYKYCEIPAFGCGPSGQLIIDCDEFVDLSLIDKVKQEFLDTVASVHDNLHYMIPFGLVPKELNGQKCLDSYLLNLKKYDQNYIEFSKNIHHYHGFKNFMAARFNLNRPWKNVLHIKRLQGFFEKNKQAEWNEIAPLFPNMIKLVDSLPFKHVGYVMIMRSNENTHLDIHRDIYPRNHNCHHINIALDANYWSKPFFIYDAITKTKHYKDKKTISYFFNECDLHGVDNIFNETLTMRIDGVFEDWFAEKIGLENSVTFDWAYDKPQDFYKANGGIKVINETDI